MEGGDHIDWEDWVTVHLALMIRVLLWTFEAGGSWIESISSNLTVSTPPGLPPYI